MYDDMYVAPLSFNKSLSMGCVNAFFLLYLYIKMYIYKPHIQYIYEVKDITIERHLALINIYIQAVSIIVAKNISRNCI